MAYIAGLGVVNNLLSFLSGGCVRLLKSLDDTFFGSFPELIDLPPDVIVNILMRLPTKSICSIKCASKTFSDIVDSPLFARMIMSRSLNNSGMSSSSVIEVPQLMLYYKLRGSEVVLEPFKYDGEQQRLTKTNYNQASKIFAHYDYHVEFVFYNLFFFTTTCSYSRERSGLLLNPLRKEFMEIPVDEIRSNYRLQMDYYGMGFDNMANSYKFVYVSVDGAHQINIQAVVRVYVLGQGPCSWRKIQAVPPAMLSHKNVCAHGDVHWFSDEECHSVQRPSHIISFDFNKEEFSWTPHPPLDPLGDMQICSHCFLLNFKGSLAIVDTSTSSPAKFVKIWVIQNYSKKEWSLYYDIDFQTLERNTLGSFDYQRVLHNPNYRQGKFEMRDFDREAITYAGNIEDFSCGEWENGIFFGEPAPRRRWYASVCYFLDLKCNSMRRVENARSGCIKMRIFSYTGSLISLKGYSNLVQQKEENVWLSQKTNREMYG